MEKSRDNLGFDDAPSASRELARVLGILKRTLYQWRVASVIVLLGIGLGVLFLFVRKPSYQSETVILYREGIRASYLGADAGESLRNLGVKLREMLFARPRLEHIIDEFGLYPDTKQKRGYVAAVDEFRQDIVFRPRSNDIFAIAYKGRTPDEAQVVAARLAEALVEENTRVRIEQAKIQTEFLSAEKTRREDELKTKERDLAKFLAAHPEFALDLQAGAGGQQGASVRATAARAAAGDPALQALERQAARSRAIINTPASQPLPLNPGGPPPDPTLLAAKNQADQALGSARSTLADRQQRYTEQHPDVLAAKARVKEAEDAVRRADDALLASQSGGGGRSSGGGDDTPYEPGAERGRVQGQLSKIETEIALRRKKASTDDPAEASETVNRVVALETEWARISRDAGEARERMAELEAKYFRAQIEASSELGGYAGQMLIIDPAYKPTQPLPPGKTAVLLGAVGAALALALAICLLRALLDDHLYEPSDMPRSVDLLAVVPRDAQRRWWRRG
ncbi:MAG: protein kinase [Polyangiaceae bacterium]